MSEKVFSDRGISDVTLSCMSLSNSSRWKPECWDGKRWIDWCNNVSQLFQSSMLFHNQDPEVSDWFLILFDDQKACDQSIV
ncbi:predicted protein [Sclerotinia sclerotiorum 1980 UF-70]|uniref:Uncharacterized protein n=1 Tax=Sclerotinia sclerotiorum (strain ATCC 18683 / 1980 / Ss-1) TaxID=665079 RepID=A7ETW6_SCLS1|nr:predicted protein [Sclerotinia sclerotiorum 1980 UF-70]EDN92908.1 predicted protein [Sclerotinia sclerotiorum 1980 UF-70]